MRVFTRTVARRWLLATLVAATAIAAVLVPYATGGGGPSPSPIPEGCQLRSPQPEAPLKLNVVAFKNVAKTIAMEKEVFNCYDAQSTLAQIKDHETFIELAERAEAGKTPGVRTVAEAITSITCVKDLKTARVSCKSEAVPLGTTTTPLATCGATHGTYPFAPVEQPSHPVEMSTVVLRGGLVKTVKVEKEVFDCASQIGDLYLFTDIVESVEASTLKAISTRFEGVICLKNEAKAELTACKLFTPGRAG
jgi:hypothetical protein